MRFNKIFLMDTTHLSSQLVLFNLNEKFFSIRGSETAFRTASNSNLCKAVGPVVCEKTCSAEIQKHR